ncbi:hypothetical protein EBZ39_09440 [bacterium]|nr:hypothetical protein [bacterium]
MKIQISKITAVSSTDKTMTRPQRPQTPMDTYHNEKPTRQAPYGARIGTMCFDYDSDTSKSPVSKPGNAGGKRII